MENYISSTRSIDERKKEFLAYVKKAWLCADTVLVKKQNTFKLSKIDFVGRKKDPIQVFVGGFRLYVSRDVYKNRVAEFDFFPDARVHIRIYHSKSDGSVLHIVDLSYINNVQTVVRDYLTMIFSVYQRNCLQKTV